MSMTPELDSVVARVAASPLSVLICGETGSGKERLAEMLHRLSPRAERPLLKLNCAALSEGLLETELFGQEGGAGSESRPGLLEVANGGTVLLDEIGEMPLGAQAKLLRVLEQRTVLRIGGVKHHPLDVRVF